MNRSDPGRLQCRVEQKVFHCRGRGRGGERGGGGGGGRGRGKRVREIEKEAGKEEGRKREEGERK